jgi:hypothetical protein
MSKRIKITLALAIYLVGCLGITINYHYCGGHLVDIAFYYVDEENCCGEDEEEDHNCCSNEYFILDTDDSEGLVAFKCLNKCNSEFVFNLHPTTLAFKWDRMYTDDYFLPHDHGPPNSARPPSFIMNHVLII